DSINSNAERQEPSEHKYLMEPTECVDGCDLGAILPAQEQEEVGWPQFHPSDGGKEPYCGYYKQVSSGDPPIRDNHAYQTEEVQLPCNSNPIPLLYLAGQSN